MNHQWNFLQGSYWYVPPMYLPALQMAATDTTPTRMTDQTVWQITGYEGGYFWGNCAALVYETGTTPTGAPQARRMAGSVTPDGNVQISFMSINKLGAATSIQGWGHMKQEGDVWVFEMQMASGVTDLVAHWALMARTIEGAPSWNQLPGTDYSVPDFLAAAGF
ncbi:hypothetical protein ACTHGU_02330 [Chitinophagaceae bacterium MMS25-I14]